jgi:hypothetical protein
MIKRISPSVFDSLDCPKKGLENLPQNPENYKFDVAAPSRCSSGPSGPEPYGCLRNQLGNPSFNQVYWAQLHTHPPTHSPKQFFFSPLPHNSIRCQRRPQPLMGIHLQLWATVESPWGAWRLENLTELVLKFS